ncbi:MAG: dihydrofolate reductase [Alphaproteobacteria bacterium]|nr:dihydrofolate reductase [Alphaproteobacteria bacterium]
MNNPYPLTAVVAMARNRVIGDGEKLLWHLPGDLPRVKALTMGRPLIMGRRTYLSIGRPLPGRGTIVLTRQSDWSAEGVITAVDLDDAIAKAAAWIDADASREKEIIIFGGGEIYAAFLLRTDRIDLTEIDLTPEGDAKFPELNQAKWREVGRDDRPAEDGVPAHAFVQLERVNVS